MPIKEYIPTPANNTKPSAPPSTYELQSSLTGKPVAPSIIGIGENRVQVPHPPKSNCKKCFGKGYNGIDHKNKKMFLCPKCYPQK